MPYIFFIFLSALLLNSCATTTVTDPVELPYEEKIVVRGILTAGEPVRDIHISRTVPVLAEQTPEIFWVKDAEASISDGSRTYPLTLQPFEPLQSTTAAQRTLYAAAGLIAESGKEYTLTVRWKSLRATAITRIPPEPTVISAQLHSVIVPTITIATTTPPPGRPSTTGNVQIKQGRDTLMAAEITISRLSTGNAVFRAGLELADTEQNLAKTALYIGNLSTMNEANNGTIVINTDVLPSQTRSLLRNTAIKPQARIYAFDGQYEQYLNTRGRGNQSSGGLFGGSGEGNIQWNVQGDGIGLFIGLAEVRLILIL